MSPSKITIIDWIRILLLDSLSANDFILRRIKKVEKEGVREEKRLENKSRRKASSGYKSDFKKP